MREDLAGIIDHTLLAAAAARPDFERICDEAAQHGFASVCVNSAHVALCAELVGDRTVPVVSTIGFPLGAVSSAAKVTETQRAIVDGAAEIDMVARVDLLKGGDRGAVVDDVRRVVDAADGRPVKVIIETCLLTEDEKRLGAECTRLGGAAFVKTSTGFSTGGATEADVRLLRSVVGADFGVKASGGVRDEATADAMVVAGANRLGTSSGVTIVTGAPSDKGDY